MQAIRFKQLMKTSHDSALEQELEQAVDAILQQLRLHVGLYSALMLLKPATRRCWVCTSHADYVITAMLLGASLVTPDMNYNGCLSTRFYAGLVARCICGAVAGLHVQAVSETCNERCHLQAEASQVTEGLASSVMSGLLGCAAPC